MMTGRCFFGLTNIRHFIYVVGGQDSVNQCIKTTKRFNTIKNSWT